MKGREGAWCLGLRLLSFASGAGKRLVKPPKNLSTPCCETAVKKSKLYFFTVLDISEGLSSFASRRLTRAYGYCGDQSSSCLSLPLTPVTTCPLCRFLSSSPATGYISTPQTEVSANPYRAPSSTSQVCSVIALWPAVCRYSLLHSSSRLKDEKEDLGRQEQLNHELSRPSEDGQVLSGDVVDQPTEKLTNSESKEEVNLHDHQRKCSSTQYPRQRWSDVGWTREEIFNWPNGISTARLLSGPLLAWMILQDLLGPALVGLVLAGISDWLDGYVARRLEINSVLGSYLDPVADKVLVGSVVASMAYTGLLHPALVALIVARDCVLFGGAIVYRAYSMNWKWNDWQDFFRINVGGAEKINPLFISKVNTVLQLGLICVALLHPALAIEDTHSLVPFLSWLVAGTTLLSTVGYGFVFLRNPKSPIVPHTSVNRTSKKLGQPKLGG